MTQADTTPPVLTSLTIDGNELVLRYTDANRLDTSNYPGPEHFVVRVNGVESPIRAVAVSGGDKTVKLTLWTPVTQGAVVTLSYNWVAGGLRYPGSTAPDKLGDVAGNHAAFFNSEPVNNLTDNSPPELITTGANAPRVDGDQLVLGYNDDHHLGADGPPATAFTVRVGETLNAVTGVLVNAADRTVTLTLATPVTHDQTVTVGYTDPTSGNDTRAVQDAKGNDAASFAPRLVTNNTPETTPPVLVTTGAQAPRVNANQLVLNFTDDSNLGAIGPVATAFTVRVGNAVNTANAVTAVTAVTVNPVAKTVTLTLASAVTHGQLVTVSYADPGSLDDLNAIQDAIGNDAASFTNQPVRNNTPDTTPPALVINGPNAPRVDGDLLVLLRYTDANDLSAVEPAAAAFTVQVNGVVNPVTRVVLDPSTRVVTLMLTTPVTHGQMVTVSYTDPSVGNDIHALQDVAGNDAASFTNQPVRNDTHDTTPPALAITGASAPRIKANQLALNYTDALDLGTGAAAPPATAFTVRVDGVATAATAVTAVAVAGKTVLLTLAAAVEPDQTVTVSYADPTGNDDAAAIQDAAGNDAASFTNQSVSVDNIPPVLVVTGPNAPKVSGDQLVLNYSDTSNLGTGAAAPPASAFAVLVDDAATAVTAVVVAGKTVTLTLARAVTPAQVVTVSYTDPGSGDDAAAIQDVIGSDAASFTNKPVRNLTDTTAPVLREATITGDSLLLNYTEATMLHRGAVPASAFRVHVDGANGIAVVDVTRAQLTGERQIRLTLARPVAERDTVTLDYARPASGFVIEDVVGNDADSFRGRAVDNRTDTTLPALVTTGANAPRVDGRQLVLHYTDTSDLGAIGPAGTTFLVRVNERANAVTRTVVDPAAKTVTLTLTDAVVHGQSVVVDYTDPGAGNDEAAIQDAAGNDAASFADQSVSNDTPEATPPVLVTTGPDAPKVNADRLVLTYADTSNLGDGAAAPLPTAFTVSVNNAATAVTAVAVEGKTVTLTLATNVAHGQPVSVSYTDPSSRDDLHAVQDTTGNDAASFANQSVINNAPAPTLPPPPTTDTKPPVFLKATIKGRYIVLYYSDESPLSTTLVPSGRSYGVQFLTTTNMWIHPTAEVDGDARTVTIFTSTVVEGWPVFVRYYGQPGYNQLQDVAGNVAVPFDWVPVINLADHTRPVLVTEGDGAPRVDGDRLVLSYTDRHNLNATGPLATAFTVRVDGVVNAVTGVVVDVAGKTVTLTLTTAVVHGQTVTVGYTDTTTGYNDALAIQDADGNDALTFEPRSVINNTPEAMPPVLVTEGLTAPRVDGEKLVLNFSDDSNLDATTGPLAADFTVRVGTDVIGVAGVTVDPVAKTVTLTLASAVTHGQSVTVSYADPSSRDDLNAIQDAIGSDAASFAMQPVRNDTPDTTPPALVIQGANAPRVDGGLLVLHYTDDAGDLGAIGPLVAAFTVRVDGGVNAVTRAALDPVGKTVTLLLTTAVTHDQTVTVSYTDPTAGNDAAALQDAAGNDAASVTNQPVINHTPAPSTPIPAPDTTPPALVTTGTNAPAVNGDRLVLHYTDASNLGTGAAAPPAAAFAVRVDNVVTVVSAVAVLGKTVTLTLASAVTHGQTVTVSYTDPTGPTGNNANDAAAVQDAAGNDAISFTNQPVRNNTPDTTPPELVTTGTDAPAVNGDRLVLHYTDTSDGDLGTGAAAPPAAAFAVRVDNVVTTVSAVAVSGKTVTLTLASAVTHGQTVAVSYTDPTGNNTNDAAAVQDAAGNDAISRANQPVRNNTPDTTAPVLVTTGTDAPAVNGDRLVLHYTDNSDGDLGTGAAAPPAAAFAVRVNNVVTPLSTVSAVAVLGKTVTLTLATAVTPGQTVTVSYTDPTGNSNDAAAVQDAAGNDAASFTTQPVRNNTPDTTPPVLVTTGTDAPTVNGDRLVLRYTDDSDLGTGAAAPPAAAFAVRVNNVVTTVSTVAVLGKTVTLTLASAVTHGQTVAVSYTDPTGNNTNDAAAVQDAAGNDAISFANQPVRNNTPDTTPPALLTTGTDAPTVNGNRLVLHYTDASDLGTVMPDAEAFAVRVNGVTNPVTGITVNPTARTVTLTLTSAVTHGQMVAVSYTDPTPGLDDSSAIQDAAGNDAASFTNQPVTNNAPDTTPPVLLTTGTGAPTVNGDRLVLHYTDANHLGATGPDAEAFAVRVNGVVNAVTGVTVNPTAKTVTLALTTPVTHGQTVAVSYTDPTPDLNDSNAIQDAAGNDAISRANQSVTNDTPDTTPPALLTTGTGAPTVDGDRLVLTYDASDLDTTGPDAEAFAVRVNDVTNAVTGVTVNPSARTVTLTLATPVTQGQTVTVNYTDPTPDLNDSNAIQDAAGNDAISFTSQSVSNISAAPPPTTPTTETSTTPNSSPSVSDDTDGVPAVQEDQIPGLARPGGAAPVAGDGNGDGIKDSLQSTVASMNGVTLVVTDQNGKPLVETADVRISVMEQKAAPGHLPTGLEMPIGLLDFKVEPLTTAGSTESFSLYVDPTRSINGYWVQNFAGAWVNLASEPYGGKVVTEGNRLRLDFKITDGGQFDADGHVDGSIAVLGAAGHMQLLIAGQGPDFAHGGF